MAFSTSTYLEELCTSTYYNAQVMCVVITQMLDLLDRAESMSDVVETAFRDLQTAAEEYTQDLGETTYDPNTLLVDKTYSAPSLQDAAVVVPDPHTVPDATTAHIDSNAFDDIFNAANDRVARESTKREYEAYEQMGELGIGLGSPPLLSRLARAQQERKEAVSDLARARATDEATMLREDAKVLHGLHIKAYQGATARLNSLTDLLRAEIQEQGENRAWSQMRINEELERADKAANYAIEVAKATNDVLVSTQQRLAELQVAILQGYLSAANLGLHGSSGFSASYSETA